MSYSTYAAERGVSHDAESKRACGDYRVPLGDGPLTASTGIRKTQGRPVPGTWESPRENTEPTLPRGILNYGSGQSVLKAAVHVSAVRVARIQEIEPKVNTCIPGEVLYHKRV